MIWKYRNQIVALKKQHHKFSITKKKNVFLKVKYLTFCRPTHFAFTTYHTDSLNYPAAKGSRFIFHTGQHSTSIFKNSF